MPLKTGLTGRTVLLPSENAREQYQPVRYQELALVQSLADTHWRIARIPSLEMGIYALGRLEFADLFPDHEEVARKILIDAKVFSGLPPPARPSRHSGRPPPPPG